MADKIFDEIGKAGAIPVAQILRTRRDFPGRNLTYELHLSGADWRSIGALAALVMPRDFGSQRSAA